MQAEFTERRSNARVDAALAANVTCSAARDAIAVQTRNISMNGLYCWVPGHILPSTNIGVAMLLPVRDDGKVRNELVQARGLVVRSEPGEEETRTRGCHIAICFRGLTEEARAVIDKYISQHS